MPLEAETVERATAVKLVAVKLVAPSCPVGIHLIHLSELFGP